jgi:lipid II:glycine glycyltransferase (peptidoglycan interpeptide bridge formation enzyme)
MAEREADIDIFYELWTDVRKKHGLPPQPLKFFKNMWSILAPKNLLLVPMVEFNGKAVAAALVLKFKDTYYFEYSASDQKYLKLCPNHKLIWEIIKIATNEGVKYFDFGRSSLDNQSLIEFKERWGSKNCKLTYFYFPKANRIDSEKGFIRKIVEKTNQHLPNQFLRWEGKFLYPHMG